MRKKAILVFISVILVIISSLFYFPFVENVQNSPPDYYQVEINEGLNLVYGFLTPDQISETSEISAADITEIYLFVPEAQTYAEVYPDLDLEILNQYEDEHLINRGFWVFSQTSGMLTYELLTDDYIPVEQRPLYQGWNFVGLSKDMLKSSENPELTFEDIKGNCEIQRVYMFEDGNWIAFNFQVMDSSLAGRVLAIDVNKPCYMSLDLVSVRPEQNFPYIQNAFLLNVPLPENSKCFWHINSHLSECSSYYEEICYGDGSCLNETICPKFYNPVYAPDSYNTFYPSACWAESLGTYSYEYGLSPFLKQFMSDLWNVKTVNGEQKLIVPEPDVEFTYQGSGLVGYKNGVFLRSSVWKNENSFYLLDYSIDTDEESHQQQSGRISTLSTSISPVHNAVIRTLHIYVEFDEAYPENFLTKQTSIYEKLMNDYFSKKQRVRNSIYFQFEPIVISPPRDVLPLSPDHSFTPEEIQSIIDSAIEENSLDDFGAIIISPIEYGGSGGYLDNYENKAVIISPLSSQTAYFGNLQNRLNGLAAFQEMFRTISHEILHTLGLPGDHVPMEYGTYFLDASVSSTVDPITGWAVGQSDYASTCNSLGISQDYYALELDRQNTIQVGGEPYWLNRIYSPNGPCLFGLYNNEILKDIDSDGYYELMYANNLIGAELQRFLGWTDVDGDNISELVDRNSYGGFKSESYAPIDDDILIDDSSPMSFEVNREFIFEGCRFVEVTLENGFVGIVPLSCRYYDEEITNLYQGVRYFWEPADYTIDSGHAIPSSGRYGIVIFPRFN